MEVGFEARLEQVQEEQHKMIQARQAELATVNALIERKQVEAKKHAQALVKVPGNATSAALESQINKLEKGYADLRAERGTRRSCSREGDDGRGERHRVEFPP